MIHIVSEDSTPLNKLTKGGKDFLSSTDLLTQIIGRKEAVVVRKEFNDLRSLSKASLSQLSKITTRRKAAMIVAAFELGRRKEIEENVKVKTIRSVNDSYQILKPLLQDLEVEEFWFIALNSGSKVIATVKVSTGGVSQCLVDSKVIFKKALEINASQIIIAHNHPSGGINPSFQDVEITKKIIEAGKVLDIKVLDHIIIGNGYYSFTAERHLF